MTRRLKTVGWYLFDVARSRHTNPARILDVARSRHTNPARIPVSDFADQYNIAPGGAAGAARRGKIFGSFYKKNPFLPAPAPDLKEANFRGGTG
jgi:hypothetical protein